MGRKTDFTRSAAANLAEFETADGPEECDFPGERGRATTGVFEAVSTRGMTCALSLGAHAEADMLHPGRSLCTLGRFGIFLGDDVLGPTASVWSGSLPARFLDFFSSLSIAR